MGLTRRGALIVLEGCDKAGKSTQAKLLAESLMSAGKTVKLMNFPDRSTAIGKIIDQYLTKQIELKDEAVHLLFSANRWELVPEILSTLRKGVTIIVDRYAFSGIAFSATKGLDLEWCRSPDVGLPKPDAVLFLNLDQRDALEKRGDFGRERYENVEFQEKVTHLFSKLKDDSYWKIIDASRPIEVVHKDCHEIILETIKRQENLPDELLWK